MAQRDWTACLEEIARRREAAYQVPKLGDMHQCVVADSTEDSYSPSRDRDDKLVFSPGVVFGPSQEHMSEVNNFLERWNHVFPGKSTGHCNEVALQMLHECMGDLSLADSKMEAVHM